MTHFTLWWLGLAQAETQTTEAERSCLARHAERKKRLAEIGVWHGVTTRRLRTAMAPDGILFAIDPYPVGRLRFSAQQWIARREVGGIQNGEVCWLRMTGRDAGGKLSLAGEGGFDFVFIDGDHSYEGLREDWETWGPLLVAGGVVALHDTHSTPDRNIDNAGSVRFAEAVILSDPRFEVVEVMDSLTVLRRKDDT
jgi:predicted O-methyltransferase YrrM